MDPDQAADGLFSAADRGYMAQALALAQRGLWTTTPNPRVGCVIVNAGVTVGEGWHEKAGSPHAEIHALSCAGDRARGATAYVNLEPCAHTGRTPPCVDALIAAGVSRVVAAMQDPNPQVAGQGFARLRSAGIAVEIGLQEAAAHELNQGFICRMTRGRPYLRLKAAISLDGKMALANGQSQWITGAAARADGHGWRAQSCALLTGVGVVLADNPRLTVRAVATPRQPLRVIVDGALRTPPAAAILPANNPEGGAVLIATACEDANRQQPLRDLGAELVVCANAQGRVDLQALLRQLADRGCNEVLAECGPRLNGALLDAGLAHELLLYQAPRLLGDDSLGFAQTRPILALSHARYLTVVDRQMLGEDWRLRARVEYGRKA
jgi:diaminohydroxyphosphoribosylaminopyrimidine deaminase/5-amino-6-(5-phosphoribosylamino)uracil reductase